MNHHAIDPRDPGEFHVLLCTYRGNKANWTVQLPEQFDRSESENISSISIEGGAVSLYTADGDRLDVPEEIYEHLTEALECTEHSVTEFDSFMSISKVYAVDSLRNQIRPVRSFGV